MFGKDEAKRQKKLAEEKERQSQAFMQQAAAPTPLQSAEDRANLEFLDWESGKAGPVDVMKAPGLSPWLDLYNSAAKEREDGQMGTGLFRLGQNGANPTAVAMADRLNNERRREAAGGALANVLRQRSAQAHGYVLPSSSLTQGRQLTLAGIGSSNASNAWARAMQASQNSGFFNSAFYRAMQENAERAAKAAG
jgi:hypothetical protein